MDWFLGLYNGHRATSASDDLSRLLGQAAEDREERLIQDVKRRIADLNEYLDHHEPCRSDRGVWTEP